MIPHWEADPGAWDRLVLDNLTLPGAWRVELTVKREIDIKKAGGVDGARFKDKGYEPAEVTFTGQFIADADWLTMQDAMQRIHPRTEGGPRKEIDVRHPVTQFAQIGKVYVTEIDAPTIDRGIATVVIRALQWVPAPKAVKKAPETAAPPPDPFGHNPGYNNGPWEE